MGSELWSAAARALFAGPGSDPATLTPLVGESFPLRVILESPDRLEKFGDGELVVATHVVQMLKENVAAPAAGFLLHVQPVDADDLHLELVGEPLIDAEGVTWRMGAEPVAG